TETISLNVAFDQMGREKATTLGAIAIANSFGEGYLKAVEKVAPGRNIKVVAVEKYAPADQSVTAQVLKVIAANPDAVFIFSAAIPEALKKGKPGTPEFRLALRDAIESLREFVGSQAVFNLSDKDHNGVDQRSQVLVRIENGQWKLVK